MKVVTERLNWTGCQSRLAGLSGLGKRGYFVQEEPSNYGIDPDFDPDEMKSQPDASLNADKPRE